MITELDYQTDYQDKVIDDLLEAMVKEHKPNLLLNWVIHPDPNGAEEEAQPKRPSSPIDLTR